MLFATVINTVSAQKLDAAQIVILLIVFELGALLDSFLFVDYLMSGNLSGFVQISSVHLYCKSREVLK